MKVRLGDIATYINGYPFKPSDWSDEGVPIIRIQDLTGSVYQTNRYNGPYEKKYEINNGDILISWSASLGVYVWKGEKAVLNQHIFKVVFDKKEVNKSYFVHQVGHILKKASYKVHGATMKHLTKPVFDALPFMLPPLEKQEMIASTLDNVNNLISLRKQQIAKLDDLFKSRFVEMFNYRNYPKVTIADLVEKNITSAKRVFSQNNVIKYIEISSIDNQRNLITGYTEYIFSEAPSRAQQHIKKGDIVISTVRPNLRNVAIIPYDDENLVASSGFCVLRADKCLPSYLFLIVCSDEFTDAMSKRVTGANYPAIKDSDILEYTVTKPPMEIQKEFDQFYYRVNNTKLKLQNSLEKLETLKKSLMQKYFG